MLAGTRVVKSRGPSACGDQRLGAGPVGRRVRATLQVRDRETHVGEPGVDDRDVTRLAAVTRAGDRQAFVLHGVGRCGADDGDRLHRLEGRPGEHIARRVATRPEDAAPGIDCDHIDLVAALDGVASEDVDDQRSPHGRRLGRPAIADVPAAICGLLLPVRSIAVETRRAAVSGRE